MAFGVSDSSLSMILAAGYAVVPIFLIWRSISHPTFRPMAASIFGGIAPVSIVFLATTIDFFVNHRTGGDAFGFYAMWLMGFGAYVVSTIVGLGISFIRRPYNLIGRFFVSFGAICLILPTLLAVEKIL